MIRGQLTHTLLTNSASFVINIIAFPLIVKSFSVADYGGYAIIGQIISTGTLIASAELYSYLRKELPGQSIQVQLSMYKSVHLPALAFIALSIIILICLNFHHLLASWIGMPNRPGLVATSLMLLIPSALVIDISRYFQSTKRIKTANIIRLIYQQLWTLILIIVYVFGGTITLSLWLNTYIICTILAALVGFYCMDLQKLLNARFDEKLVFRALSFSVIVFLAVVLSNSGVLVSRFLIVRLIDLQAVALFFFAFKFSQMITTFTTTIINFVTKPHIIESINKNDLNRQAQLGGRMLITNAFIYIVFALPIMMNMERIILLFGKSDYLVTQKMILLLLLAGFIEIFHHAYHVDALARGKALFLLRAALVKFIIGIVGTFVFLKAFGLVGAVLAFIITKSAYFLVYYYPLKDKRIVSIPMATAVKLSFALLLLGICAFAIHLIPEMVEVNTTIFIVISSMTLGFFSMLFLVLLKILSLDLKARKILVNWS